MAGAFAVSILITGLPDRLFDLEKDLPRGSGYSFKEFRQSHPWLFCLCPVTMLFQFAVPVISFVWLSVILGPFLSRQGNLFLFYFLPFALAGFMMPVGIIEAVWKISFFGFGRSIRVVKINIFEGPDIVFRGLLRIAVYLGFCVIILITYYLQR